MSDCCTTLSLTVGRTVVSNLTTNYKDPTRIPWPEGVWFDVPTLCRIFLCKPQKIWKLASLYADRIGPPTYNICEYATAKSRRIFSYDDYQFFRTRFPITQGYYKKDRRRPDL